MTKATAILQSSGVGATSQDKQEVDIGSTQMELVHESGLRLYAKATAEGFRVWSDSATPAQVQQSGGSSPVINITALNTNSNSTPRS